MELWDAPVPTVVTPEPELKTEVKEEAAEIAELEKYQPDIKQHPLQN